jgi:hypothetical protein
MEIGGFGLIVNIPDRDTRFPTVIARSLCDEAIQGPTSATRRASPRARVGSAQTSNIAARPPYDFASLATTNRSDNHAATPHFESIR